MLNDALLATLHHLLAFVLLGVLTAEAVLLRLPPERPALTQLTRVDLAYGFTAGLLFLAGVARVMYGTNGTDYYLSSLQFWIKMAAFTTIGLISIKPTLSYLHWERGDQAGESLPDASEWLGVRRWVHAELVLFPLLLLMAALIARGGM